MTLEEARPTKEMTPAEAQVRDELEQRIRRIADEAIEAVADNRKISRLIGGIMNEVLLTVRGAQ